jgi:Ca2+-binding EF-hand superfamily protein
MRQVRHPFVLAVCLATLLPLLLEAAMGQDAVQEPVAPDAVPTPATKAKKGKGTADPEQRRKEFQQRDVNKNGQLTLDEQLDRRQGSARAAARDTFFRSDTDGDDLLSVDEFLDRDPGKQLPVHSLFRLHDLDDDGQLTEEEFMRTKLGKKTEQSGRMSFQKFDVNRDRRLSEREFAMTPAQKPTIRTMFSGLDVNGDAALTRDEFVAVSADQGRKKAHRNFFQRDQDRDNKLSYEEYAEDLARLPLASNLDFRVMDFDADGLLTLEEFCERPPPIRNDEAVKRPYEIALMKAEDHFRAADLDHDGRLSPDEFKRANRDPALAADDESGEEVQPMTSETLPKLTVASGTGAKKLDLFMPLMIASELLVGVAILYWWFARNRAPTIGAQRSSPSRKRTNLAEI